MKQLFLPLLMMVCTFASAQSKYSFHSLNYLGILSGSASSAFQLHSVNGFQRRTWYGGVGLGLDFYYQTTVPLYASFSKFLTNKPSSFFLTADGGTNFVWDNSTANFYNGNSNNGSFKPGFYYGAHAGYKLAIIKNKGSVLLNFGYTAKQTREKINQTLPCLVPPCPQSGEEIKYNLRRVSFRVGWQF